MKPFASTCAQLVVYRTFTIEIAKTKRSRGQAMHEMTPFVVKVNGFILLTCAIALFKVDHFFLSSKGWHAH
eukprot:1161493-Pelagomonas_calceolata.AAC.2